jgi:gliding motility-associated-like protein
MPVKNSIFLEWDGYSCPNAKEFHIYKRSDSSHFEPQICETGLSSNTGFQFLDKVNITKTNYEDDGIRTPVAHGREYCYRIVAVFQDGAESIASNETCAAIATDAPMITNVDVVETSKTDGIIFISWLSPPEIDTFSFPGPNYEYRIFRSNADKTGFEHLTSTHSLQDTSFIDESLNTQEITYYYKIEFWGENIQKAMEWVESSDPASSIYLSIYETDKRLQLSWNEEVPWVNHNYTVYRFNNSTQQFDSIANTSDNFYEEWGLINGENYCYYIKSIGKYLIPDTIAPLLNRSQVACGEPVDNIPPDTPITEIKTDCNKVTFLWTFPFADSYLDAFQYFIYYQPNYKTPMYCIDSFYYDACYSTLCSRIIENLPSITGCYSMIIRDEAGNYSEMTPKLCFDVDECDTYSLPNVFTPDGDGYNETWYPFPYTNVEKIDLVVYDRWGRRVFATDNPDIQWDGKDGHSHRPLSEGTYYYGCDVFFYALDGVKKKFLSGTVMILRSNN